jgi:hypothetical protein
MAAHPHRCRKNYEVWAGNLSGFAILVDGHSAMCRADARHNFPYGHFLKVLTFRSHENPNTWLRRTSFFGVASCLVRESIEQRFTAKQKPAIY